MRERVRPPIVHVQEAAAPRPDPKPSPAIAKDRAGIDVAPDSRARIRLRRAVDEPPDSPRPSDQEHAIVVLTQAAQGRLRGNPIELRRTRFPPP